MKHILYTIVLAALLAACTDDKLTDGPFPSGGGEPGEPVSVGLSIKTQPMQSPLFPQSKAGNPVFSSTEVCGGLEVSLVETSVTRSSTEIIGDKIQTLQVLQFNGTTGASRLVKKEFYTVSGELDATLKNLTLAGSSEANRIIVIANILSDTFAGLTANATSGTTLSEFEGMGIAATAADFPLIQSGGDQLVPMAGSTDMIVTTDKQADIMLYRAVAKVTVNITVSKKMVEKAYAVWQGQLMHVPAKSFFYSIGQKAVFPQPATGYVDYPATTKLSSEIPTETDGTKKFSQTAYLPVNLQLLVPYTTPELRGTNAPVDATYLQIMGLKLEPSSGAISESVIYQVHLGGNFTDNYSITPNHSYTYNITMADENTDDSRVVKFIPGYFGGSLKAYKADGTTETNVATEKAVWRYEKQIEVYITDVAYTAPTGTSANTFIGKWSSGGTIPSNSYTDGRNNTFSLNNENYPAAKTCINLTPGSPANADALVWYLPAYDQALGIYAAGSSTVKAFPDISYWTSSANGTNVYALKIKRGETLINVSSADFRLRCIRELTVTP